MKRHKLWDTIAAKLGLIPIPTAENAENPVTRGVTDHIKFVFEKYLELFEASWSRTILESYMSAPASEQNATQQAQHRPPQDPPAPPPAGVAHLVMQQAQMNQLAKYASMSAEAMRSQRVSEDIIRYVEINREVIQRQGLLFQQRHAQAGNPAPSNIGSDGNMVQPTNGQIPQRQVPVQQPVAAQGIPPQIQQAQLPPQLPPQLGARPFAGPPATNGAPQGLQGPPSVPAPILHRPTQERMVQANQIVSQLRDVVRSDRGLYPSLTAL